MSLKYKRNQISAHNHQLPPFKTDTDLSSVRVDDFVVLPKILKTLLE